MADAGSWRGWSTPGPRLDRVLVGAVLVIDVVAQIAASADDGVRSAPFGPAAMACAVVSAAVLLWRRSHPIAVLVACGLTAGLSAAVAPPGLFSQQGGITIILGCYAIGSWSERRVAAVVVPLLTLALLVLGARDDGSDLVEAATVGLAAVALPWMAGRASRSRRQYLAEVEQRLAAAEAERDERARRAVLDERNHIARELHDVVAHHVSLIGVQAGAARTALDADPEVTRTALQAIEDASRAAVGEMHALLGALHDDEGSTPLAPLPGVAQLDALVDGFEAAGLTITLTSPEAAVALPAALDLTTYRIVEQALTNVTHHSAATTATVVVVADPTQVRIVITDPGPARSPARAGSGLGLVGIAERVAHFGGDVRSGPTADGGFEIAATLPRSTP